MSLSLSIYIYRGQTHLTIKLASNDQLAWPEKLACPTPFSQHPNLKQDHLKYARALAKSFESRWHFDGGALSEPEPQEALNRTFGLFLVVDGVLLAGTMAKVDDENDRCWRFRPMGFSFAAHLPQW